MRNIMFCMDNIFRTIGIGGKAFINRSQDRIKNSAILYNNISFNNDVYSGKKRK